MKKARIIAFYLPQYHPIRQNDEWWGKGFTEWTNVAKARPLFRGHYQPHIPADLGFYDLRLPEVRQAQAEMAKTYGIEGFCYYHYWFAGKRLLERPFNEVLQSRQPDFPFCLCWANESWSGVWHGAVNRVLIEQTYPGPEDEKEHFRFLLKAFSDERYIKMDGKPLFIVYCPNRLPEPKRVTDHWRKLAIEAGFKDLFLVGNAFEPWDPAANGFDGQIVRNLTHTFENLDPQRPYTVRLKRRIFRQPGNIYDYARVVEYLYMSQCSKENFFPCMVPNWDNTPRAGRRGIVFHNSNPDLFLKHAEMLVNQVQHKPVEKRLIFLKSWNEWAEGNHLEPDIKYGHAYLEALHAAVNWKSQKSSRGLLIAK
ncbi:MAG: glycoside hydrolase family 99-like domain-containing protein [Sedimentisphaerales bacterium]